MDKAPSILVVDRSRLPRFTLARAIRREIPGAKVTECSSPRAALALLEEGAQFDMITTSLVFPDMDGLDLIRRLQAVARGHDTPVVVVSAQANSLAPEEGLNAGISAFFDKSKGHTALLRFIHEFTQRNFVEGRLLYVEDDLTTAATTRRLLESHGLELVHATKAEEALAMLEQLTPPANNREQTYVDMVLTDYYLKGEMTAIDLVFNIRSKLQYSSRELPVLIITGNGDDRTQVKAFRAGANDFVTKPFVEEALLSRIRSLLLIRKQYQAIKLQTEQMCQLSICDRITGAYDRHYFLFRGERLFEHAEHQPLCIFNLAVDNLIAINERHGRQVGDEALKALVDTVRKQFPKDTLVARFGGETFYVLIPKCSREQGRQRAERLRRTMAELRPAGVALTISQGLAAGYELQVERFADLIAAAERELARARAAGNNQISLHSGDYPSRRAKG